jgi:hypothetical protein
MSSDTKLMAMQGFAEDNFSDACELVDFLELGLEDIILAFPEKLRSKYKECFFEEAQSMDYGS